MSLVYGTWYAYTVFLVALLRDFGWSRSTLAGAFSVFTLVHGAMNPLLGGLCDRLGPRRIIAAGGLLLALGLWADSLVNTPWQLYLAFGGLTAAGVATAGWTPAVVLVQRQFTERLGLALGIAGAGIGLGIFLVVPLCQALIDSFGWRVAFRVLSGLAAVWILPATWLLVREAPAAVLPEPPAELPGAPAAPGPAADMSLAAAMVTRPFWVMASATFLGNLCSQTLHVHQAAFLVDHGATPMVAASVVSVVGASSIIGKTGGGWLSDLFPREVVYVLGMAFMLAGVGVLLGMAASPTPWLPYAYAVLFGAGYSVTASLVPAMVSDRFRGRHFGSIFGVTQIGGAAGSALGAWQAGHLFDVTGSYVLAFTLGAAAALAATTAVWAGRLSRRRHP
ncbi:MAG: hypothetical protein A2X52_16055 [Candidatus Rokubacteria bacterium GWC2_70_16]|nr:MAG: hypothetical protein A2X52_16055 [Candidatus Rokubacteria bacterium GWC2_70_16]